MIDTLTQLQTIRAACQGALDVTPDGETAARLTRAIDGLTRAITSLMQIQDGQPITPECNTHISGAGHAID